jgi:Rieske 2Fe-2S family protein
MSRLDRNFVRVYRLMDKCKERHTLPQAFYNDPDIFQFDVSALLTRSWLLVGFEAELTEPGAYSALTIGRNPIVIVKGRDGAIRGFHNTCRHRGSQICADGHGKNSKLICPYHKWTYDLEGRLIGAARMSADFDSGLHALNPIRIEVAAGCIYACLSATPPDFGPFRSAVALLVAPYRLDHTKVAYESVLVERANWKLVMENARECYHCATAHPELKRCFPVAIKPGFDFGDGEYNLRWAEKLQRLGFSVEPQAGAWWHTGRYPLNPGVDSISADGQAVVGRRLSPEKEIGGARWSTEANSFCHMLPDYCFMFSVFPIGPEETLVVSKWLVHRDALEGVDYDIEKLTETWTATNLQDRALAENNQRGVNGMGYVPGPYSQDAEDFVIRFADWYRREARAAAAERKPT